MKKTLIALGVTLGVILTPFSASVAGEDVKKKPEVKLVCIDKIVKGKPVLDKKGKPVQICKKMKKHKKLKGTKVPGSK